MMRRSAFTLVELLVVMTLIVVLIAIGAAMMPSKHDRAVNFAASRVQGWLLIAKQRARRDGLPTGLRLRVDADGKVRSLEYVQQPEDFSAAYTTCQCNGSNVVTFSPGVGPQGRVVALDLSAANLNPGDVLEFNGGGGVYPIRSVDAPRNRLILTVNGPDTANNPAALYRIFRQPLPLTGENPLELPDDVLLDPAQSLNVPIGRGGAFEILFSPQGGLIGRGTSSNDVVVLWLQNTRGDSQLLTVVKPHTGFISVEPAGPSGNPFQFCRDARASGL